MKLIVGLGNPGKRYQKTRHNIGFVAVNALQKHWQAEPWSLNSKFNAEISSVMVDGKKIHLLKPMTFMNESGQAVQLFAEYYKISPKDILILHDDKDIPLGEIKIQNDRGHAGHNGIRSIIDHIGTKDFSRVRIGVANAKKQEKTDTSDFVLGKFGLLEWRTVIKIIEDTVRDIEKYLKK